MNNTSNQPLRLALDGNEANIANRVGSNVYGFKVLEALWKLTQDADRYDCTVLLASQPIDDLPAERPNWRYEVVTPRRFWTQWALPLHLFWFQRSYDVFYTPSHYAARVSAVPYVNTIHDVAYLKFPEQFSRNDLFQLKHWTAYSVKRAKKVIAVSQFSKQQTHQVYGKSLAEIVVASPAISLTKKYSPLRFGAFLRKQGINKNRYFLYLGTLQPRKNLEKLVAAFEEFCRFHAANELQKKSDEGVTGPLPQLVLAGKVGWLARGLQDRIANSPVKKQIILTGFVDEGLKKPLYEHALATVLVGHHEGFGIPPLESLSVGTPAIVANEGSLPEVVGSSGLMVNPDDTHEIAEALREVWDWPTNKQQRAAKQGKKQARKFSWQSTGRTILKTLEEVAAA